MALSIFLSSVGLVCAFWGGVSQAFAADSVVTLLHTNDLHSHFREDGSPLHLGGVARIKTAVDRIRQENPSTLLLDGGDFSEGSIYYTLNAGTESVRMMDRLGYDVVVVGNHEPLNGPGTFLDAIANAQPRTQFVASNLDPSQYSRKEDFKKWIQPYVIREVGGVRIAFIGLATYEFIYDKYFDPIQVTEPFLSTRYLAQELKKEVDFVVAISHNSTFVNQMILKASPDLGLIIGGHDHKKHTEPVRVSRGIFGWNEGWVVETGCWGQYLGHVDLKVSEGKVTLGSYQLHQMDASIPSDPEVIQAVERLEDRIETQFGPIFHDHIGDTEIEFHRRGFSSPMGDLVTDSYRDATQADFSMDMIDFISGEIHIGAIRSVDVFNAHPAVYSPKTQKAWTLKVIPVSGRVIKVFLNTLYAIKKLGLYRLLNVSGLTYTFDPIFNMNMSSNSNSEILESYDPEIPPMDYLPFMKPNSAMGFAPQTSMRSLGIPVVMDLKVGNEPLDSDKIYKVATGQGVIEAIEFMNTKVMQVVDLTQMKDTGVESWRLLADHIRAMSPITQDKFEFVSRARPLQADLGISYQDVQWKPVGLTSKGMLAKVAVRVKNYGATASDGSYKVRISANKHGNNYAKTTEYQQLGQDEEIPSLQPGEEKIFYWKVNVPLHEFGPYSVTAQIQGADDESNPTNNEVTRWF